MIVAEPELLRGSGDGKELPGGTACDQLEDTTPISKRSGEKSLHPEEIRSVPASRKEGEKL